MNKEKFIDTLQACYFGDKGAFNLILKEYEELQNKIDKAIEYINDNVAVYAFNNKDLPHWEFNDDEIKILLKILKDSDVNE